MNVFTFQAVHQFWFGDNIETDPLRNRALWWRRPPKIDETITEKFSTYLTRAALGDLDFWKESPAGLISLVVLLDQFPRHIYRGRKESFAFDEKALKLALDALGSGADRKMHWAERQFLLLPLEHSENLEIQKRSVQEFDVLVRETPPEFFEYIDDNRKFAVRHLEIIERFGRFPHRNQILGRTNTAEETEFLKEPNSSF